MYTLAVVTGTRAEYGLLRPVLAKLGKSASIKVDLLVTGTHLSNDFGHTVDEIRADGHAIAAELDILSQPVPPGREGTARRTALALQLFLDWFTQHPADAMLALGDRYEMLAAGQAAALLGIPLIHISGGDVTAGADDDWFRHCLTKMAKLHFPSCEAYRRRLIRMGEQPRQVFNVGGLGDENIRNTELLPLGEVERQLRLAIPRPYALVTLHPETAGGLAPGKLAQNLLQALAGQPQLFLLFTAANADAGGEEINAALADYCQGNTGAAMVASLGTLRYLSLMAQAAVVVGNSSSGVVETPSLGVPTVDIGGRQAGRITGENVIHCAATSAAIATALETALSPGFAQLAQSAQSPYNGGDSSGKIVSMISAFLDSGALKAPKVFYDGENT